jgi:predicted Zn-dependent peptidase
METGPVLIVEPAPHSHTAAIGAWIRGGSADEPAELAGITHLLEHLLLRRCGDRSSEQIAELIDALGGAVDAFTTREACAITAHVPADRQSEAIGLILDALFEPTLLAEDVRLEQKVVDAEFDLVQDSPVEVAAERALEACWGDHPLARPVLGTREHVKRLGADDLQRFHRERFGLERLLLVLVSPTPHGVIDTLANHPHVAPPSPPPPRPTWRRGILVEERDGLEQIYANLVLPGLASADDEAMTLAVLHQLLGGGASSRLFRELRERLGLVYEVETATYSTSTAGLLEVTFSCPARQAGKCWDAVLGVLDHVAAGGIADHEVVLAKQAIGSGLVLGAEGADAVMEAHAGEFLARGLRFDVARLREELEQVTPERVRALGRRLIDLSIISGAVCGPHGTLLVPASLTRRVA